MIIEGDLNLQLWPFYFGVLFLRWKKRKQTGNNFCNFRTFTLQSPRKFNTREKKTETDNHHVMSKTQFRWIKPCDVSGLQRQVYLMQYFPEINSVVWYGILWILILLVSREFRLYVMFECVITQRLSPIQPIWGDQLNHICESYIQWVLTNVPI